MLRHQLQSANIFHSMQIRLLFKIDYVCKIPRVGSWVISSLQSIPRQDASFESENH